MQFWYSGEVDSEVYDAFMTTRKFVESRLNGALSSRTYGSAVAKIAIIPIVLGPRFANRPERKLLQHSKCSADYRLKIDFEAFRDGNERARQELLIRNTIQAIADISRKTKKAALEFEGESLTNDVLALFSLTHQDLERYDPPDA
jgi:hypothetical protein